MTPRHTEAPAGGAPGPRPNGKTTLIHSTAPGAELPHSAHAEQTLCGIYLNRPGLFAAEPPDLTAADYFIPEHRVIFQAFKDLTAAGYDTGTATVATFLEDTGKLESAGGMAYLGVLARETPEGLRPDTYATIIRAKARDRRLIELAREIAELAANPASDPARLAALAAEASALTAGTAAPDPLCGITLIRGSDIMPEAVSWLWGGWLARGKVHVVAGAPGTGKTSLALSLAATLTVGGTWPDGTRARPSDVALWSGEDDPRDTLIPRLIAAGADMARVRVVAGTVTADGTPRAFDAATDIVALADELANADPRPALLIVDPVVSAVAGDSHKNAEVRRSLQPLVDLAVRCRCAVLGISHFSKGTQGRDPTERVTGSLAFGALARVVLATAKLPDEQGGGRILVRSKSNLGADSGGFAYNLEVTEISGGIQATRVIWGARLEGSARELLGQAETTQQDDDGDSPADVAAFVRGCLADGPVTAKQMQTDANGAGHSWDRVKRAASRIGVERK